MIRTAARSKEDILKLIPAGEPLGILGCGDCAAILGTGGTRQVDAWAELLNQRNPVVFSSVIEAPCDQRILRRLLGLIPNFSEAHTLLLLVCPAGAQSFADLIYRQETGQKIVIGLVGEGPGWLSNSSREGWHACHFCETCTFSPEAGKCFIAACPLKKSDGPCQNRLEGDFCPLQDDRPCVFTGQKK